MTLNYQALGKRVKAARKKQHLSQAELAEMIDISSVYVSCIETGNKGMRIETLVQIANALLVSVDELLEEDLVFSPAKKGLGTLAALLEDCTSFERKVILETVHSLKRSLQSSRKNHP